MYNLSKNTAGQDSEFMIRAMDSRLRGASKQTLQSYQTPRKKLRPRKKEV